MDKDNDTYGSCKGLIKVNSCMKVSAIQIAKIANKLDAIL